MAEAVVTLRVDATSATTALRNVQNQTNKLSNASRGATKSLHGTSAAAKGLGASLAASLGPLLSIGAAFATVSNALGTFTARDRDIKILEQGLRNLGAGATTLNELQEAADKFGKTTLFNEEDFTRGFNLLTSFRNIGVDAYERVAQSAADIAQVNQVDVSTSFMQLAKALQDPERNLSNLNRSGIAFTKTQQDVIKELMKTNRVAEAHAMILDIVDESYNQLAQAAAGGFAGSVDTLGESFRDFSETLGKLLVPVIEPVVKGLTQLLNFLNTEGGQAVIILTTLGGAAKALSLTLPLLTAATLKLAAAGGVLAVSLNALPFAALATAAGLLTTQIIKTRNSQKELNDAIKEGASEDVAAALEKQKKLYKEIDERLQKTTGRSKKALEDKLKDIQANIDALEARDAVLVKEQEITAEKEKQNEEAKKAEEAIKKQDEAAAKLKERFMEIGKSVEEGIVQNLTDAVMGTKSLAEAAKAVLDDLKRQLIELAMQQAVSGLGNFIGNALGSVVGGAFGGGGESFTTQGGKSLTTASGTNIGKIGFMPSNPAFKGAKAKGGPVTAGDNFLVGEKGPEIFTPSRGGTIIPNKSLGGQSIVNNININVDASGTSVQSDEDQGNEFGERLASAVQAVIVNEKRVGGLLA